MFIKTFCEDWHSTSKHARVTHSNYMLSLSPMIHAYFTGEKLKTAPVHDEKCDCLIAQKRHRTLTFMLADIVHESRA